MGPFHAPCRVRVRQQGLYALIKMNDCMQVFLFSYFTYIRRSGRYVHQFKRKWAAKTTASKEKMSSSKGVPSYDHLRHRQGFGLRFIPVLFEYHEKCNNLMH